MATPAEARGPGGRRARLRRWGLGEQVFKTTLAVVLAWELGTLVPGGTAHPYFAPLAALLSFQITVAESITAVVQRVLGIVVGVGVALLVSRVLGETVWGVGLLVFLALVLGANLRLSAQGVSQVAVSALIVMFVGGAGSLSYASARIVESVVGALIGVAVNALLIPPTFLPEARAAEQALGAAVAARLADLGAALAAGLTPTRAAGGLAAARALAVPLAAAQAALNRAETGLKYNVLRRAQQAQLTRYRRDLEILEHAALQVRSLARTLADSVADGATPAGNLSWAAPSGLGAALGDFLAALGAAVAHLADGATSAAPSAPPFATALAAADAARRCVEAAVRAQAPVLTPAAWMHVGALLAIADRLRADLEPAPVRARDNLGREL